MDSNPLGEGHPIIFPQNVGSILQLKPSRFSPRARARKNKCMNQVTNILQRGSADYSWSECEDKIQADVARGAGARGRRRQGMCLPEMTCC